MICTSIVQLRKLLSDGVVVSGGNEGGGRRSKSWILAPARRVRSLTLPAEFGSARLTRHMWTASVFLDWPLASRARFGDESHESPCIFHIVRRFNVAVSLFPRLHVGTAGGEVIGQLACRTKRKRTLAARHDVRTGTARRHQNGIALGILTPGELFILRHIRLKQLLAPLGYQQCLTA